MKFVLSMSVLIGLNASAAIPTRVILKCQNPGEDRTLKIEETPQAYAITMTDFAERQMIGSSYVYKSQSVEASPTKFSVGQINGTKEYYTIEIQALSGAEGSKGDVATIYGEAPAGVVPAKEKVFRTLVPDALKFDMELLKCTH